MNVDLHVHTNERSFCADASADEQIHAALAAGLDAIVITDHGCLVPRDELDRLNRRYAPLQVYGGIEVTTDDEDVLVLGVQDAALERRAWTYPDLHAFVQAHQGFMVLAHPFRYRATIGVALDRYRPDAIEVYSANTPMAVEGAIRALATQLRLTLVSNSDAHTAAELGTHYTQLPHRTHTEWELLAALKSQPLVLYRQNGRPG